MKTLKQLFEGFTKKKAPVMSTPNIVEVTVVDPIVNKPATKNHSNDKVIDITKLLGTEIINSTRDMIPGVCCYFSDDAINALSEMAIKAWGDELLSIREKGLTKVNSQDLIDAVRNRYLIAVANLMNGEIRMAEDVFTDVCIQMGLLGFLNTSNDQKKTVKKPEPKKVETPKKTEGEKK